MRQIEEEKRRLKALVGNLTPDKHTLSEALGKETEGSPAPGVGDVGTPAPSPVDVHRASELTQVSLAAWCRPPRRGGQTPLRHRIRELALVRPRSGDRRTWGLLRREGWQVNRKRVRLRYWLEGL